MLNADALLIATQNPLYNSPPLFRAWWSAKCSVSFILSFLLTPTCCRHCALSAECLKPIICQFRVMIKIIGQQKRPIENMNAFVPLHVRVSECLISGLSRWRGRPSVGLLHLSGSCPATPAGSSSGFYLPATAAAGTRPPSQIAAGWTG